MAREITLRVAMDDDGTVCVFKKDPPWCLDSRTWDATSPDDYMIISAEQAKKIFGCDLNPGDKITLGPMPIGRRQKARRG